MKLINYIIRIINSEKSFIYHSLFYFIFSMSSLTYLYLELRDYNNVMSIDFTNQLNNLDNISEELENLQLFISVQKNKMSIENEIIDNLKNEKQLLEPLLQVDKKIIEAVFIKLQKSQNKKRFIQILIAFFTGITTSIIGSYLFNWIYNKRKNK